LVVAVAVASLLALPCGVYAAAGGASSTQTASVSSATVGGTAYGSATATPPRSSSAPTAGRKLKAKPARSLGDRVPLRRGMRGHDVKILQDFLNRVGLKISIDGTYGTGTYRAVRRFQKRAELPVNGVIRVDSINRLREVLDEGGFKLKTVPASTAVDGTAPGPTATINPDGTATAPAGAPAAVVAIIDAGNEIATKPYKYGGGHGSFEDSGYDCSGSVSYALHGANLLTVARDSTGLQSFGQAGPGQWVTTYGKASHAYMVVAGLRFDTSGRSKGGTRWQTAMRSSDGYVARHPVGL
jgi:peptidoglycan hydrolase-like protein with peptidoglycan-binding domain